MSASFVYNIAITFYINTIIFYPELLCSSYYALNAQTNSKNE